MKHLWISVAILVVLFGFLAWNTHYLGSFISPLKEQLTEAAQYAKQGDWDTAESLTKKVHAQWQKKTTYLHTTLRHTEIDQVNVLFDEIGEFIECHDLGEYVAANANLIAQMALIYEMEELSFTNVF